MFLKDSNLLCICVVENDKVSGVITRAKLSQLMSGRYGYSLYQKKKICKVMDENFLEVDYQMPISGVSRLAMSRSYEKLYDSIIVTKQETFLGVVTIKDLLEKTTEIEVVNAKHQNPLSGLPGNVIIEQNITKCVNNKTPFSVLYLDLDNFKAYNDVYGFEKGDLVIKLLAHIMDKNTPNDGFKGHIGGDDFIIILNDHNYEDICTRILNDFDEGIMKFYNDLDISNGYIETKNRRGRIERFPIMTLSIAGITNKNQQFEDIYQFSEKLSLLKKQCKKIKKSNFCIT
jgi:GGDEF domain-containing protein